MQDVFSQSLWVIFPLSLIHAIWFLKECIHAMETAIVCATKLLKTVLIHWDSLGIGNMTL